MSCRYGALTNQVSPTQVVDMDVMALPSSSGNGIGLLRFQRPLSLLLLSYDSFILSGDSRFTLIVQECKKLVVLFLCDLIKFVVVTLRAANRQAQPDIAGRGDAVKDTIHAKLLWINSALLIDLSVAMEARGYFLGDICIRK